MYDDKSIVRISSYFLFLWIMFVVIIPEYVVGVPSIRLPIIGTLYIQDLLTIIVLLLILIRSINIKMKFTISDLMLFIWLIYRLISFDSTIKLSLFVVVIPYIIGRLIALTNDKDLLMSLFKAIGWSAVVETFFEVYGYFVHPVFTDFTADFLSGGLPVDENMIGITRAVGTIGHPVPLAAVLLPGVFTWLELAFGERKLSRGLGGIRVFALLNFIFVSFGIFLTMSRGALISFFICFLAWLLMRFSSYKYQKTLYLLSVIFLIVYLTPIDDLIYNRFVQFSTDVSFSHRALMILWATDLWLNNIINFVFGYGYRGPNELLLTNPPYDGLLVIDNAYLTVILSMGLLGVMFIALGLILPVVNAFRTRNRWLVLAILGLLLEAITFDEFYWMQPGILLFLLIGIAGSIVFRKKQKIKSINEVFMIFPIQHNINK